MKIDLQLCGTNKQFDKKLSFGKVTDDNIYDIFLFAPNGKFVYLVGKAVNQDNMITASKEIENKNRTKAMDQKNLSDLISQLEEEYFNLL